MRYISIAKQSMTKQWEMLMRNTFKHFALLKHREGRKYMFCESILRIAAAGKTHIEYQAVLLSTQEETKKIKWNETKLRQPMSIIKDVMCAADWLIATSIH